MSTEVRLGFSVHRGMAYAPANYTFKQMHLLNLSSFGERRNADFLLFCLEIIRSV